MKVVDLFAVSGKTIFAGKLETAARQIEATKCKVVVDGSETGSIEIDGEVLGASGHRDLWTKSPVDLTREIVQTRDVWLIAT